MTKKPLPSPDFLCKILRYEPDTGKLFWKERPIDTFMDGKHSAERRSLSWNSAHAGKPAFYTTHAKGYSQGFIDGKLYLAHRVIWAIHYYSWPAQQIDHINGEKTDNRIINLREVSPSENSKNMRLSKANTSGVCGVIWCRRSNKWIARIYNTHLGSFDNISEAANARKIAEKEYGFHANHGGAR